MWIPKSSKPSITDGKETILALNVAARALKISVGPKKILTEIYKEIFEREMKTRGIVPAFIAVNTDAGSGDGLTIDNIQALYLDEENLLGAEDQRVSYNNGLTGYIAYYYSRKLDMNKLYELIGDESLPRPEPKAEALAE